MEYGNSYVNDILYLYLYTLILYLYQGVTRASPSGPKARPWAKAGVAKNFYGPARGPNL